MITTRPSSRRRLSSTLIFYRFPVHPSRTTFPRPHAPCSIFKRRNNNLKNRSPVVCQTNRRDDLARLLYIHVYIYPYATRVV